MILHDVAVLSILISLAGLGAVPLRPRDLTLVSGSVGEEVVDAVIGKLRSILAARSDYDLLRRIAAAESNFGMDTKIMSDNPNGGIWQINMGIHNTLMMYKDALSVQSLVDNIKNNFELSCFLCSTLNYSVPMHSGLVAFLYTTVSFSAVPLPTTIEDQGEWWAQHYHDGVGAAGRFTEKAEQMSNHTACGEKINMDLWLLVDVSESVSEEDFQNVKNFSRKLREIFPYSGVRFGWSLYSFAYEAVFKFSNQQDWFIETINAATRPLGRAGTGHALSRVVGDLERERRSSDELVHTVLLLITVGDSYDEVEEAASKLHESRISTHVIGLKNPNISEIETIASEPNQRYLYILPQYSDLKQLVPELFRALCSATIPLHMGNTILMTSLVKTYLSLSVEAPFGKTVFVNFSTQLMGFRTTVYFSAVFPHPNSACYDISIELHKGATEIGLKAEDFSEIHPAFNKTSNENFTIYMTLNVPNKNPAMEFRLSARTSNLTIDSPPDPGSDHSGMIVLAVFIVLLGIIASVIIAVTIYRSSKYHRKFFYKTKTRENAKEALKIMQLLLVTTVEVKETNGTVTSMLQLQQQLEYAEEKRIPKGKLTEFQKAVNTLKERINTLRSDLREATDDAKKTPNYLTMTNLEELIEKSKKMKFLDSEMKEPTKVLHTIKKAINHVEEKLMAYTARAAVATATTIDENKLNQILEDATDLRFPSAMLFESRDTLDRLRCRIANVKDRLAELTAEAFSEKKRDHFLTELDETIVLAQLLKIPDHFINPALKVFSKLKKSTDTIKQHLLKETLHAEGQTPSVRSVNKLKQSINKAEGSQLSSEVLQESKTVLTKLETQIDNLKKRIQETSDSIEASSAGYPDMMALQKLLNKAEEMGIPKEELSYAYDLLEVLQTRIYPVLDSLKEVFSDARGSTASLYTLGKLESQLSAASGILAPSDQIEEAQTILSALKKIQYSIRKTKRNLETAIESNDSNILFLVLKEVRNNEEKILAWNPEDEEFKDLLQKATEVEKSLIKATKSKNKHVTFNIEDVTEKLQINMQRENSDWYEFRILKEEYEKFCAEKGTTKDKKFLSIVRKTYLNKTKDHVLFVLESALASSNFETLENAINSMESLLETENAVIRKLPAIKSTMLRAKQKLLEGPKSLKTVLKDDIKAKLDGKIDEIHKAVKLFEDEFEDDFDNDDRELIAIARRLITVKFKKNLVTQLRTHIEDHDADELEKALARFHHPLSQQALHKYELLDRELLELVESASEVQYEVYGFQQIEEQVDYLTEEEFLGLSHIDHPTPQLHDAMVATLLLLGHAEEYLADWETVKPLLHYCKTSILETDVSAISQEQAQRAREMVTHIQPEDIEESSEAAALLLTWTKHMIKKIETKDASSSTQMT